MVSRPTSTSSSRLWPFASLCLNDCFVVVSVFLSVFLCFLIYLFRSFIAFCFFDCFFVGFFVSLFVGVWSDGCLFVC